MTRVEDLDCQACAACCHGDEGWVHVDASDDVRVDASPALQRLVVLTRHGGYVKRSLKMIDGACAGLSRLARDRFSCTVYDDRPSVCRTVERGSDACRSARRAQGLDAVS
jgi:Fe-S-cluster containining protein